MDRSVPHVSQPDIMAVTTPTGDRTIPRPSSESTTKTTERSAVVLALFGPSVGPCVGDFSTTYNRVNGRLYAATRAILFYSNLFGFERRLCLHFSDIESIESYRSTSIRIAMVDCEDHIFRKFINRDHVLKILKDLYHQAFSSSNGSITARVLPIGHFETTTTGITNQADNDVDSIDDDQLRVPSPSELSMSQSTNNDSLESSLRPRSQSVPSMNKLNTVQEKTKPDVSMRPRTFLRTLSTYSTAKTNAANDSQRHRSDSNEATSGQETSLVVVGPSAPPGFDMSKAWEEAKEPYSELALNIALSCSLEAFMDMFFSNDATFSISRYQEEVILDKEVNYSKWKKRPEVYPPIFDRDINFVHPLNNSVGPSQAKTNRRQSFQRFGALGATLQNVTIVNGVPSADCFRVEDRWSVESIGESSVHLRVTFRIVFTKRTMFKPIIQKNVKAETKKWFHGYAKYLRQALQDDKKEGLPPSDSEIEPLEDSLEGAKREPSLPLPATSMEIGLFIVVLALVLQIFLLQRSVSTLNSELFLIRSEQQGLVLLLNELAKKKC